MKKIFAMVMVGGLLLSLHPALTAAQSVEEVLNKMIEAQGGRKIFESIKDSTLMGTIEIVQQGLEGTITVYKKEPDKRRADIEVMGMLITQAYDGKIAWFTNPQTGAVEELQDEAAEQIKREAMPILATIYPEKYGMKHKLKEKETIEGKEYLVLDRIYPDGFTITIYVDPETFLTFKSTGVVNQMGMDTEFEQYVSDYKKVNGMVVGHSVTTYQNGEEYMTIAITEMKINTGLEDSLFVMEK